jgi:hypothetical protein
MPSHFTLTFWLTDALDTTHSTPRTRHHALDTTHSTPRTGILAAAVQSWADFGIILAMLCINAILGFREEYHASLAMRELAHGLKPKVTGDNVTPFTPFATQSTQCSRSVLSFAQCSGHAVLQSLQSRHTAIALNGSTRHSFAVHPLPSLHITRGCSLVGCKPDQHVFTAIGPTHSISLTLSFVV